MKMDVKLEDAGKIKVERDMLRQKLKQVEDMLACEENPGLIVKGLREFLGINVNFSEEFHEGHHGGELKPEDKLVEEGFF